MVRVGQGARRLAGAIVIVATIFCCDVAAEPLRLKTEHPKAELWSLRWFADRLTGLEFTGALGRAAVSSTVRPETGPAFRLASGRASYRGFSASLLDAPRATGVGIGADFGFFSHASTVRGFREAPPSADGEEVPAVCRLAGTGREIPCEPNTYSLDLWSLYLGPELYAAVVLANSHIEIFGMLRVAVRMFEYRSITATLDTGSVVRRRPELLRSAITGLTVGATLPRLHLSGRLALDFERYLRFAYAQPLELLGPATYEAERDIWVRERIEVDDASLDALSVSASIGVLF